MFQPMDRKRLFKQLAILVFFIFILNFLAGKFYWYSEIWWFDMPMHFMGGLWLGLSFIWLFSSKNISTKSIVSVMLCVLVVGVAWELFELYFVNHIAENPFNLLDTLSDLFFDLAGGSLALVYLCRNIMNSAPDTAHPVVEL